MVLHFVVYWFTVITWALKCQGRSRNSRDADGGEHLSQQQQCWGHVVHIPYTSYQCLQMSLRVCLSWHQSAKLLTLLSSTLILANRVSTSDLIYCWRDNCSLHAKYINGYGWDFSPWGPPFVLVQRNPFVRVQVLLMHAVVCLLIITLITIMHHVLGT